MEMIWCEPCSTVVWAYDHQQCCDLRSIVNRFGLSCPLCGKTHCFDGWGADSIDGVGQRPEVFDEWSAMRYIANMYHLEWRPSTDNSWHIRV